MFKISYMRKGLLLVFLAGALFACKGRKGDENRIIGKWHAVKMENPDMDSFFVRSQKYIDTVGKGHDDATNIALYGVANMDSMRKVLQVQFDSAKLMQMNAVTTTIFTFRKDHVALLSFNGTLDSSKWNLDTTGKLVLAEMNPAGPAATVKMELLSITDSMLVLRMQENGTFSTVTFHMEGK